MSFNRASSIKQAQKEELIVRELSKLLLHVAMDDSQLRDLFVSRVKLSPDRSMCSVYFYHSGGAQAFKHVFPTLILYKPSMRKALSTAIPSRYTPELMFKFDRQFEKQQRIEELLEKIKDEIPPDSDDEALQDTDTAQE